MSIGLSAKILAHKENQQENHKAQQSCQAEICRKKWVKYQNNIANSEHLREHCSIHHSKTERPYYISKTNMTPSS